MNDFIIHDCEQRSPEWFGLRRGRFTASLASVLVTAKGNRSVQWKRELGRIIAESRGLQEPENNFQSYWMERGIRLEDEARGWMQVQTGLSIDEVGFIQSTRWRAGVSPDGVIYDGDIVIPCELKVPKPSTHIAWLMGDDVPDDHISQCHMALAITGAPFMHFMSYSPALPSVFQRVERSAFTETMEAALTEASETLSEMEAKLFPEEEE